MADARKDVRLEEFSPEAQEVVTTKQAGGRKRLSDWKALIDELADLDAASDRLQARSKNLMVLGIVFIVLGGIGSAIAAGAAPLGLIISIPFVVGGLVLAFYQGARWRRFKAMDLANDFRLCLPPLLDALAEDVEKKARVQMTLDLAGATKAKITQTGKIPPGRFRKIIETVYHDPWCHMAAPLADGSQLVLDIANELTSHERHWTKRGRRGKIKFKKKTKWRKVVVVSAAVVPNAERLAWDTGEVSAQSATEKLKLAEKKGAQVCRLIRKFKFSAVNEQPAGVVEPKELVGMFMHLFTLLQPAEGRS